MHLESYRDLSFWFRGYSHPGVDRTWCVKGICSGSFKDHTLSIPGWLYSLGYGLLEALGSTGSTKATKELTSSYLEALNKSGAPCVDPNNGLSRVGRSKEIPADCETLPWLVRFGI